MERIHSFDFLKGLALFFVVLIHVKPFRELGSYEVIDFFLVNTGRFAVPVFFLIAGYIFSIKIRQSKDIQYAKRYIYRIARLYVLATAIFLSINLILVALSNFVSWEAIQDAIILNIYGFRGILNLLYLGNAVSYHLWFLPALLISIVIVYIADRYELLYLVLPISLILHLVGIASNTYLLTDFTVPDVDALFFGLFYTTTGFYIGSRKLKTTKTWFWILAIVVFGFANLLERCFIMKFIPSTAESYYFVDYSLLTAPLAISIFMYALSKPNLLKDSRLAFYGKNVFWGYAIHPIVISIIVGAALVLGGKLGVSLTENTWWNALTVPLTYFITMEGVIHFKGE